MLIGSTPSAEQILYPQKRRIEICSDIDIDTNIANIPKMKNPILDPNYPIQGVARALSKALQKYDRLTPAREEKLNQIINESS